TLGVIFPNLSPQLLLVSRFNCIHKYVCDMKEENRLPGSGVNEEFLFAYESAFSVAETMNRIEHLLKAAGTPIFAKFDHGLNAKEVSLELRPTQVIVFGSPQVGTFLMQQEQSFSIELPLKIAVWEDKSGSVWIAFPRMNIRAEAYGRLTENPIIAKMDSLLQNLARKAGDVYS
ncbi:MAG: DUF302 domain-containing protein, partial [Bacteroidales bacterium]